MSSFVEILSPKAKADLEQANAELVKMLSNMKAVNSATIGAKTPSGSDSALKSLTAEYTKQEQAIAKIQKQLEKARLEEIKLQQAREKAFDKFDANLAKEQAKLNASANLYNKVQVKMNALSVEYKNLATRKELGIALTDKETQRYGFLQAKIQTYDKTLKAVDATMGKYTRNVGNYASGFNPLNNSINQLTREMPAFTYSVQTGFMALSNNIPIFTDAIGNAIAQNKELQAQGKPTQSVLSQLAGAFFSWQTLLGVGITLLTVYGKEIGEFIKGLTKGNESIQTLATQTKQLNEARKSSAELASKEISELDRLYKVSQNVTLSIDQRKAAVDRLQELYPNFLANIADENILNGKAEKQYYKLRDAILAKYTAQAIGDKLAENAREGLERFLELQQKIVDTENEINRLRVSGNDLVQKGSAMEKTQTITISNADLILAQERLLAKLKKDMLLLKDSEREKNGLLIKTMEDLLQKSKDLEITETKATATKTANTKATADNNKEKEKEIQLLQGTEAWYEKQISDLKSIRSNTADTTEEYKSFNAQLDILEDGLKSLRGELAKLDGEGLALDLFGDDPAGEFEKWRKSSTDEVENATDSWADDFNTWSNIATDAINTVADAQKMATENRLIDLEKEKEIALAFAGGSAEARLEIERQYTEKRREIMQKQAENDRKMAIFSSIINTARGVIAALTSTPPNVPLSIAVGIIGAAQTALIASQQIPQFAVGTDNAPEGWAWTQERGREIITDRQGKIKSLGNDKGATKTYLNKGDKVFTAQETKQIMFNNELNGILQGNGISQNNINNIDLSSLNGRIDNLTNVIKNKSSLELVKDRRGERIYEKSQGMKKELVNNRLKVRGYDI
jgi:hypothetical protein